MGATECEEEVGVGASAVMEQATASMLAAEQQMLAESQKLRSALSEFEANKAAWETQKATEQLKLKQIGAELKKEWDALAKAKAKVQAESAPQ